MSHEQFQPGESIPQLINRIQDALDRKPYDEEERDTMIAELEAARALTDSQSANHRAITEILKDIAERYGK